MKKLIDWILGLFKKQETEITFEAWPFPAVSEDFNPRPCEKKTKPRVKKATTRPAKKTTTKKPAVAAKTARTKKAK